VTERLGEETGIRTAALGGGCFQNARLLDSVTERLRGRGMQVLLPRRLGPNDGAVSYGQAVVAAARMARGCTARPDRAESPETAPGAPPLTTLPAVKE